MGVFIIEYKADTSAQSFKLQRKDYKKVSNVPSYNVTLNQNRVTVGKYNGVLTDNQDEYIAFGLGDPKAKMIACYKIDGDVAGGRFVIYENGFAELTVYGSGVPIIFSYLGRFQVFP